MPSGGSKVLENGSESANSVSDHLPFPTAREGPSKMPDQEDFGSTMHKRLLCVSYSALDQINGLSCTLVDYCLLRRKGVESGN